MAAGSDFLSFNCKRTDRLDIKTPLSKYVHNSCASDRMESIYLDIEELVRRRTEATAVSGGGPSDGSKEILASYYRALCMIETRFPVSREAEHIQLGFYWTNAMNPRKKHKQMNIHFEKASVLFNIGAHLSQQAATQNRDSQEGYKTAIQNFQEAASIFAQVKDIGLKVENPKPSDLTADFLSLAEKLMLAQGQECVLWKARKEKKSSGVLSRIARQASVLFSEALGFIASPVVREDLDRTWQDLFQSKSWLFEALCQHHAAEDARSREDISTEISRLNQSIMLLQRLKKSGKFMSNTMPDLIKEVLTTDTHRLKIAERDNASVYMKKIPPFNELPLISGAQLVKLTPVTYLDASRERIFEELVPEQITKAMSRYSELVDNLIRKQTDKLNGATDEARIRLKEYELPEILDAVTTTSTAMLPEPLKQQIQEIEESGGIGYLDNIVEKLKGLKMSSKADLSKAEEDLDNEAREDSQCRTQYGDAWKAKSSASLTMTMRKHIGPYKENFEVAEKSDETVQKNLEEKRERLERLSLAMCTERFPKLEPGMVNATELEPQTIVANIRECLEQLDKMSNERAGLEESMKEMRNRDNLLSKLASTGVGSHEELFKTELKKYDSFINDVEENIQKQKEMLNYLQKAVSNFSQIFDIPGWKKKVETYCSEIKADITSFYTIRDNLGEAMRFYDSLKTAIDVIKKSATDFALSRRLERQDQLETLQLQNKSKETSQLPPPPPTTQTPPPPPEIYSKPQSDGFTAPPPPAHQHQMGSASTDYVPHPILASQTPSAFQQSYGSHFNPNQHPSAPPYQGNFPTSTASGDSVGYEVDMGSINVSQQYGSQLSNNQYTTSHSLPTPPQPPVSQFPPQYQQPHVSYHPPSQPYYAGQSHPGQQPYASQTPSGYHQSYAGQSQVGHQAYGSQGQPGRPSYGGYSYPQQPPYPPDQSQGAYYQDGSQPPQPPSGYYGQNPEHGYPYNR